MSSTPAGQTDVLSPPSLQAGAQPGMLLTQVGFPSATYPPQTLHSWASATGEDLQGGPEALRAGNNPILLPRQPWARPQASLAMPAAGLPTPSTCSAPAQ